MACWQSIFRPSDDDFWVGLTFYSRSEITRSVNKYHQYWRPKNLCCRFWRESQWMNVFILSQSSLMSLFTVLHSFNLFFHGLPNRSIEWPTTYSQHQIISPNPMQQPFLSCLYTLKLLTICSCICKSEGTKSHHYTFIKLSSWWCCHDHVQSWYFCNLNMIPEMWWVYQVYI